MTADDGTTRGEDVFRQRQLMARSDGSGAGKPAPTSGSLTRHGPESFLDRLTRAPHAQDFVLKGGILLAVYGARRQRKMSTPRPSTHRSRRRTSRVVRDVAAVDVDDGVVFDVASISVQEIRETARYPA